MRKYALYQGDKFIMTGTTAEIAEAQNIKKETVAYYRTNKYKERLKLIKSNNSKIVIPLENLEDGEVRLTRGICFADRGPSCKILIRKDCNNCKFFKTQEEYEEEGV